jgi:HEPN domain-containing protein
LPPGSAQGREREITLEKLGDDPDVPDDVIGFHAQQALEKLLKAALAHAGVAPPRIHHLGKLLSLLVDEGKTPPVSAEEVRMMIPWAVDFRYDDVLEERLDRDASREAVEKMRAWVDDLLAEPKP